MAETRESFPTLEIDGTEVGAPLTARVQGETALGKTGSIGFAFRDSADNVVLPKLNAAGQIPVTSDTVGNGLFARGTNAGSGTQVTIATLALAIGKRYEDLDLLVSCFRDATFQLIWNDDGAETILADVRVGPGSLSSHVAFNNLEFLSGASGTQQLLVKGKNENAASTMTATVSVKELS